MEGDRETCDWAEILDYTVGERQRRDPAPLRSDLFSKCVQLMWVHVYMSHVLVTGSKHKAYHTDLSGISKSSTAFGDGPP